MTRQDNKPKLRFPEFQGMPEWEEKKLGEVVTFYKGQGLPKSEIIENGMNECIHYGELFTQYSEVIINILSRTNKTNGFLSRRYDVLMPTSDVTPNGLAKACCIRKSQVILGGDILVLRPISKVIYGYFLSRYIRSIELKVLQLVTGTTVYHLYASHLQNLIIKIPTLPEQQKIADCLTTLDDRINAENDKLTQLKEHKKGLMQKLFPREGQEYPDYRFPEFQNAPAWEEKRLEEIGQPSMCKRIFKEQTSLKKTKSYNIPFYKIGTLGGKADAYISRDLFMEYKENYSFPKFGDILISASGTIGKLVTYDGLPAYFQDSNIVWLNHDQKKILNSFLFYCLSIIKWQTSDGGVIKRLYNSDFKNIITTYPRDLQEQQKIADCLSALDDLINAQHKKIELLKAHKKGLMEQLFI